MLRIAAFLTLVSVPFPLIAQDCDATPSCQTILHVTGESGSSIEGQDFTFSLEQLQELGIREMNVVTPWAADRVLFEGIYMRDLLASLDIDDPSIFAAALNGYQASVPTEDFYKYDVILAYAADGDLLQVRDRGPLWIMYPWGDMPTLREDLYNARSVWQLYSIQVSGT